MKLLTALVLHLQTLCPKWKVEDYPDRPANYTLSHPVGAILVQYGGSQYGHTETTDVVQQKRSPVFGIRLVGRNQHGPNGVVTQLNFMIDALVGRKVAGHTVFLVRDWFVAETQGVWEYQLDVKVESCWVTGPAPDEI